MISNKDQSLPGWPLRRHDPGSVFTQWPARSQRRLIHWRLHQSNRKFRSKKIMAWLVAVLLATLFSVTGYARIVETTVDLPVEVLDSRGDTVRHSIKVTIFRDDARARSSLVVLNHGRATTADARARFGRSRYSDISHYLVGNGYAVFLPTRIGYGVTGGPDVEGSGSCANRDYPRAVEVAVRQTDAVLDYAHGLPWVEADRGLLLGVSYGGMTSIAVAAKNPPGILAAINFAGGGGGDPVTRPQQPCSEPRLKALFARYGETARIPTLWLYSENDKFFGVVKPLDWFEAFLAGGAKGRFVKLPPLPPSLGDDGHATFTRNPAAWRPHVEAFLKSLGAAN